MGIDSGDMKNSVCGVNQSPHILLGLAKFDDLFPRYR